MARANTIIQKEQLTLEEWRERLRREKQRKNNVLRATKMHKARLKAKAERRDASPNLKRTVYVGCSGWRYGNGATRFMRACRNLDGSSITQEYSTLLRSMHHFTHGRPSRAFRHGGVSRGGRTSSIR